jgi:hypothetical protein
MVSFWRESVIQAFDPSCLAAFERLLATPDPPEMQRHATRPPIILMSRLQRRHLELDREEPIAFAAGYPCSS